MKIIIFLLISFFGLAKLAIADDQSQLNLKEYKYCNFSTLKVTIFRIKIYDISLCNDKAKRLNYSQIYDNKFTLSIKYDINIKSKKLVETSIAEMKKYYQFNQEQENNIIKTLSNIFPNVTKGDIISAKFSNNAVSFKHNNKNVGEIKKDTFGREFLDIWLHPKSEYEKMRLGLLQY